MSSDALRTVRDAGSVKDLCNNSSLAVLRPEPPDDEAASLFQEASVSKFGGIGRPSSEDSRARRDEFLRLVFEGVPCEEAAKLARVKPERALAILSPLISPLLAKAA